MALEWLKTILGEHYTDEIDKSVSAEIGKAFVAKADFDAKNTALKTANDTLKGLQETVKKFDGVDVDKLKTAAADAEKDYNAKLERYRKDSAIDIALMTAKARSPKAARALLADDKITLNQDGTLSGIKEQLEALQKSDKYLFDVTETRDEGDNHGGGDPELPAGFMDSVRSVMGLSASGK